MRRSIPLSAAMLASCWLAYSSTAMAHGREPRPTILNLSPDGSRIVLQTGRGLMASKDDGASWQWMCYEAVDSGTFGITDPAMTIMGDGSVLTADRDNGVLTLDPTWCNSSTAQPDPASPYYIYDVVRDPVNPDTAYALTSTGTATDNRLYESTDDGRTWTATSTQIQTDTVTPVIFETIGVAPSAPNTIYVSGVANGVFQLFKSTDGGATWGLGPIYSYTLPTDYDDAVIAGIDPSNANHLFLIVKHNDSALTPPAEKILMSTDGGSSFNEVLTSASLAGIAISDDGTKVWTGDNEDGGFYRSTDGGATFSLIPGHENLLVPCLAYQNGKLYVCGNDLDPTIGYGIATSTDDGNTLNPLFRYCQISTINACPATSPVGMSCSNQAINCDALSELELDIPVLDPACPAGDAGVAMPICAAPPPVDAGVPPPPPVDAGTPPLGDAGVSPDGGTGNPFGQICACRVAGSDDGTPAFGLGAMLVLGLVLAWRRRRNR